MVIRIPACYVPRAQRYRFELGQYRPDGIVIGLKRGESVRQRNFTITTQSQHHSMYKDYLEFWRARKKVYVGDVLD